MGFEIKGHPWKVTAILKVPKAAHRNAQPTHNCPDTIYFCMALTSVHTQIPSSSKCPKPRASSLFLAGGHWHQHENPANVP
jgi:hypothetical protein